jgi:hypothetical protein
MTACTSPLLPSNPTHRTPYAYLPVYGKVVVDLTDSCAIARTTEAVESALAAYARTYGEAVETWVRESVLLICGRRFADFDAATKTRIPNQ